ncbi:MAG: hypothetical protein CVV56_06340 [Tenericutes bacterium HGW-Tenericutes-1]|nr:MAG: hypothetical protein CVV56_06340 [Tenericutes bacterium HGW-Tenericutes-1]
MMNVIMITAIWCPSCIIMRSRYDELLKHYNITKIEYDFDDDTDLIAPYKIGSILPVVIFMKDNEEILRIIGEKSKKELTKLLEGLYL